MKDPRDIIIAPVVSEKSYALSEGGAYTFKVHPSATKPEIHDAVEAIWKSLRNLDHVHICGEGELNAYDVLVSDWVIFTPDTVPVDRPVTRGNHAPEEAS